MSDLIAGNTSAGMQVTVLVDDDGRLVTSVDPQGGGWTPRGYQQISNATLAASTPLTVPEGATFASIQNNGAQPARFLDTGVAPTASTGQRLATGETLVYTGTLSAIRFIREADSVTLDILYYS